MQDLFSAILTLLGYALMIIVPIAIFVFVYSTFGVVGIIVLFLIAMLIC